MARKRILHHTFPFSDAHGRPIEFALVVLHLSLLCLLCVSVIDCSFTRFNNSCIRDHFKYGSNCEDEFPRIRDGDSIMVNNTGIEIYILSSKVNLSIL